MKTSVTDHSRMIQYDKITNGAGSMRYQVVRFVRGIRGLRKRSVNTAQILQWFHGTPEDFVLSAIASAVSSGFINSAPGYAQWSITPAGEASLKATRKN